MNFYASRPFLDAAAAVYFPGRSVTVENVAIGDEVLRLLVTDEGKPVTRLTFLDFHEPLRQDEIAGPVRPGRYAERVVRGNMPADAWDEADFPGCELAPFIDWTGFASFDAYYEQRLIRHHGLMRDRERRGRALASRFGRLRFYPDDHGLDVLAAAQEWKSSQLIDAGLPDLFADPTSTAFLKTLHANGHLLASTLRAEDRLVSVWLGFIHDNAWSGWIFAYDPALKKYSAGHQLLIHMLRESCARGHREFDFSVGAPDYKMQYATHGRLLGSIGTPSPHRALALYARNLLRSHSPALFASALRWKARAGALIKRANP